MLVICKNNVLFNSIRHSSQLKQLSSILKENFTRKIKKVNTIINDPPKISKTIIIRKDNNVKLEILKTNFSEDFDEISKILCKNTISINDENLFFFKLELINKSSSHLENKFFERIFWENLSKLKINSTKNIILIINFIEKFDLSSSVSNFKIIEKKIHFQINFFDPDTLIKTLILFTKFFPTNYPEKILSFQVSIERLLTQFSLNNLTKIFYLFSKIKDISFLNKINKQVLLKLNAKQKLSSDDISRLTMGILYSYSDYDLIHPNIWAEINDNIINEPTIDLKNLSFNLILLAKSNFFDKTLFERIEKNLFYLMIEMKLENSLSNEEKIDKFEDLSRILNSYAITSKGSSALWLQFFIISENYIDCLSFSSINIFIEILLHKSHILNIFCENPSALNQINDIIHKIIVGIEEIYSNENFFSIHCLKMNIKEFCESIVKIDLFSEKFTELCLLILKKLSKNNANKLNNKF